MSNTNRSRCRPPPSHLWSRRWRRASGRARRASIYICVCVCVCVCVYIYIYIYIYMSNTNRSRCRPPLPPNRWLLTHWLRASDRARQALYICLSLSVCVYIYIYIYIYMSNTNRSRCRPPLPPSHWRSRRWRQASDRARRAFALARARRPRACSPR